jgi:hypothetical protein
MAGSVELFPGDWVDTTMAVGASDSVSRGRSVETASEGEHPVSINTRRHRPAKARRDLPELIIATVGGWEIIRRLATLSQAQQALASLHQD